MKKCSMCGECKEDEEFRFLNKQNRRIAYCVDCEKYYQKLYGRIRRERLKEVNKNAVRT